MKVKSENELTLHWAEMRMISWMCGVKLRDLLYCFELMKLIWSETVGLRKKPISHQKIGLGLGLTRCGHCLGLAGLVSGVAS